MQDVENNIQENESDKYNLYWMKWNAMQWNLLITWNRQDKAAKIDLGGDRSNSVNKK